MFFPISDDDRGITTVAYVTHFLLVANILVFLYQLNHPEFTSGWSVIPREITTGQDFTEPVLIQTSAQRPVAVPQAPGPPVIWLTLLTAMFMHGGIGHIAGNMLYLWIFGNNVEHRFGHAMFLGFYLLAGLIGSIAQIAANPDSVIPNLGASGAIAGVMGAYLVLYPRNKINAVFFYMIVTVPAIYVLGMWGLMQFFNSVGSLAVTSQTGGVAYLAHLGGFVAGALAAIVVRSNMSQEPDSELRRQYQRDPTAKRIW